MRVGRAAVIENDFETKHQMIAALTQAGVKVTGATALSGISDESMIVLGPTVRFRPIQVRAAHRMFPSALLLSAQRELSAPSELFDGLLPLPLSHRDLAVRLPELLQLKQWRADRSVKARPGDGILDPRTGLYTFPHFKEVLFLEVKRARRYGYPLAIGMAAVDGAEAIADLEARSRLVVALALAVRASLRDTDFPVQYSADRLLFLMPHTDLQGAVTVSQRTCERANRLTLSVGGETIRSTLSIGVSAAPMGGKPLSLGDLVRQAHVSLEFAIQGGGNRVEFFDSVADGLAVEGDFLSATLPASA